MTAREPHPLQNNTSEEPYQVGFKRGIASKRVSKENECYGTAYLEEDEACQLCRASEGCKEFCASHSAASRPHPAPAKMGEISKICKLCNYETDCKEHDAALIRKAREDERQRAVSIISKKAHSMEGKKLFGTVLELCQEITGSDLVEQQDKGGQQG